jgi:hypothetical protein
VATLLVAVGSAAAEAQNVNTHAGPDGSPVLFTAYVDGEEPFVSAEEMRPDDEGSPLILR